MKWLRFCMFATKTNAAVKQLLFFFLISLSAFAQKDYVAYRGVENPIRLDIQGIDKSTIVVTGKEVKKDAKGNYTISPGGENETKVIINYRKNGKPIIEKRVYIVKPFPMLQFQINGKYNEDNTYYMSKAQLMNLKVEIIHVPDFDLFINPETLSFDIKIPGFETITCKGNKLNDAAKHIVQKIKRKEEIIVIDNIKRSFIAGYPDYVRKVSPVVIILTD